MPVPDNFEANLADSSSFDFSFQDSEKRKKSLKSSTRKIEPKPTYVDTPSSSTIIGSNSKYVVRRLVFGNFEAEKENSSEKIRISCSVAMDDLRYFGIYLNMQ